MKSFYLICLLLFTPLLGVQQVGADDAKNLKVLLIEQNKKFFELWKAFKYMEALDVARGAYEMGKKVYHSDDENLASLKYNYGMALSRAGYRTDAVNIFDEVYQTYEAKYGKKSLKLIHVLTALGKAKSTRKEKVSSARKYFNRALKITQEEQGENDEYINLLLEAGYSLLFRAKSKSAHAYIMEAYERLMQTGNGEGPNAGFAAYLLGRYYVMVGKTERSLEFFEQAVTAWEHDVGTYDSHQNFARGHLVAAYEKVGQRDRATEHCLAIGAKKPWRKDEDYQPLYKTPPNYPLALARRKAEGYVVLEFTVDEMGFVTNPKAIKVKGGEGFINASIKAVKNWRYAPRFVDGEPVATEGVRNILKYELPR